MNSSKQFQHVGRSMELDREFYLLPLTSFSSFTDSLSLPRRPFVVFLASDARDIDVAAIENIARILIRSGCIYFCAWGPDCEKVHDIFDECCYDIEPVIMTTWHDKDSLDSALWFFINSVYPDEGYGPAQSGLLISIGNPDWNEQIVKRLRDIDSFNKEILGEN